MSVFLYTISFKRNRNRYAPLIKFILIVFLSAECDNLTAVFTSVPLVIVIIPNAELGEVLSFEVMDGVTTSEEKKKDTRK